MKRRFVWSILLVLLVSFALAATVEAQPSDATIHWFIDQLSGCFDIQDVHLYPPSYIPSGWYALYYTEDPQQPILTHDFGWYSEDVGCGALYRIVTRRNWGRTTCGWVTDDYPHHILPCDPAVCVNLIPGENIGFYLNFPYDPNGRLPQVGGHYFTDTGRNWDGFQHAYIYKATYYNNRPCNNRPCIGDCCRIPEKGVVYLLFWEDWCGGGDGDFNDMMVAIFPAMH